MHAGSALSSILYVLIAALISAAVLARLRQPNLIGYLIGGLLIGPHGLGLVPYENVELLAEVGIGLLMFTIGVELSIPALLRVRNISIFGGSLIVIITTAICYLLAPAFRWGVSESIVWGLTLGLSSTVVVLKLLAERGEVGSTHGNISTGILLFQDAVSIPILVFIPLMAAPGAAGAASSEVGLVLLRLFVFLLLIYFIGRFLVPRLLRFVANTHSKELFSISVLCLTLGIAAMSAKAGLSLALGAFLAGLIVSESDFGNQAASEVLPLKDAFSAVFFVSVGMLLDFGYFLEKWPTFTFGLAAIVVLKFFVVLFTCFLFRYQSKISVFVALSLAQIGEFGFLILLAAKKNNLIGDGSYQRILGISILSIISTPYLLKLYPKVKRLFAFVNHTSWIGRPNSFAHSNFYEEKGAEPASGETKLKDHVIVCGYGPTGSIVAKKLQSMGLQVVVVDLNYKVIQGLKASKQYAVYGDSSSMIVLEAAGLLHASLLVVTIPDPFAMQALVKKVKAERPNLTIVMRVKYMSDRDKLLSLGADDIVWEEYEAGQELTRRALDRLNIQEA
jgi:CPA2 family monovalent cation:H+ antiporter-2